MKVFCCWCFKTQSLYRMTAFLRNKAIILSGLITPLAVKEIDFGKFKQAEGFYISDPWERVKSIFTVDEFGNWHPELIYAFQMTQIGALTGGVFGGIYQTANDIKKFMRTSDTHIYASKKEAYRALNNLGILSMSKGALKWAPSFALFCGGFVFISSCCELYYNNHRIINGTIAGTSIGVLFKASNGIKGMISGGVVGGFLGTIYGIALWGLYKISNTNHMQYKYAHFAYAKYKQQLKLHKNPSKNIFDQSTYVTDCDTFKEAEENSDPVIEKIEKNNM